MPINPSNPNNDPRINPSLPFHPNAGGQQVPSPQVNPDLLNNQAQSASLQDQTQLMRAWNLLEPSDVTPSSGDSDAHRVYDDLVYQVRLAGNLKDQLKSEFKIIGPNTAKQVLKKLSGDKKKRALSLISQLNTAIKQSEADYNWLKDKNLQSFSIDKSKFQKLGKKLKDIKKDFNRITRDGKLLKELGLDKETNLNPPSGGNAKSGGTSIFIEAAKILLKVILGIIRVKNPSVAANPNAMIAKYSTGSKLAEQVKNLTEAGMTDEVVNKNPLLRHEALDTDQKAAGVKGEFDTMIQFWKEVLQGDKQAEKDTHDQAKRG